MGTCRRANSSVTGHGNEPQSSATHAQVKRLADIAYLCSFAVGAWLLAFAFTTRDKVGLLYFMAGAPLLAILLIGFLVRVSSDRANRNPPSATSVGALIGALAGALIGMFGVLSLIGPFAAQFAYQPRGIPGLLIGAALCGFLGAVVGTVFRNVRPA